jgi:hypothetical protein
LSGSLRVALYQGIEMVLLSESKPPGSSWLNGLIWQIGFLLCLCTIFGFWLLSPAGFFLTFSVALFLEWFSDASI